MKMSSLKRENDSVFVGEWRVPTDIISDSSEYLRIKESGESSGERLYKVHLVVYTECGSLWVASAKELVKYSPAGTEVARIKDDFYSISDISVNSRTGELYVIDGAKNSFSIYDSYGGFIYKNDSLFKSPSGMAIGVDGDYVWVADAKTPLDTVFGARLRRFHMSDSLRFASVAYEMSGPIRGLSINQNQSDFVWFAVPQRDTVGFTKGIPNSLKFIPHGWNRPSMVSHDLKNKTTWIADSSRIVAMDTSGRVLANIKGFDFVSSVAASNDYVWASDILSGKVYLFKGPFRGLPQDTSLTISSGTPIEGFIRPISVSAYDADGGVWVIDKETGAVRLDSVGTRIASGTGLNQLILGKTSQKVD